jgi:hypothetical protein
VGEDDATGSLGPEQSSDLGTPRPAPPASGWYRIPDNPNYEHFWNGHEWTLQRYWGGVSSEGRESPYGPPPIAGSQILDGPPCTRVVDGPRKLAHQTPRLKRSSQPLFP